MSRIKRFVLALLVVCLVVFQAHAGSQQTSSTLASTIITNARYILNEPSAKLWADAELLVWVNQGTVDIVGRTHCLVTIESVSLVANTYEYTLTGNYIGILDVVYKDASTPVVRKGLIRSRPGELGNVTSVGEPVYWYESSDKLGVFPVLSSVTSEAVDVHFVAYPAAVGAAEAVKVPAAYDIALIKYVAAMAFLKDGQFAKSGRLMAEYMEELERYRFDYNMQPAQIEE